MPAAAAVSADTAITAKKRPAVPLAGTLPRLHSAFSALLCFTSGARTRFFNSLLEHLQ